MSSIKIQTLKGFRDFLPEKMRIRNLVLQILVEVFEQFGFAPLQTPTVEYASTLLGKYGQEADKLVYTFKDRGEREIGLNYDLTVPTARVLTQYQGQIPLPFKRYQIQSSFRAENPQKGRYRQFIQCDVDIFGVPSTLADAEIITIIYAVLKKLKFEKFKIKINSRQVLFKLLEDSGIQNKDQQLSILQTIDKLDKKGEEEVKKELIGKGFSEIKSLELLKQIKQAQPDKTLKELFNKLNQFGINQNYWEFSPSMVRGLDYYTGPIYETYVEEPKIGSITGGGRYDNLVKQLGGPDIPATGTTIGFERICDVIEEMNLWPEVNPTSIQVLVTVFGQELLDKSLEVANKLRGENINTELWLEPETKLDKQLKYADQKKIPYVIIIGPNEAKSGKITLKNLQTQTQETISLDEATLKLTS